LYQYGVNDGGHASILDVGRGGFCVRLGRYLRPGTRVIVRSGAIDGVQLTVELKGAIVWCCAVRGGHDFLAGLRVLFDEPETICAMSQMVHAAVAGLFVMRPPSPPITAPAGAEPFTEEHPALGLPPMRWAVPASGPAPGRPTLVGNA
jgi:hypothetical protein